jgi:hypothetical protein
MIPHLRFLVCFPHHFLLPTLYMSNCQTRIPLPINLVNGFPSEALHSATHSECILILPSSLLILKLTIISTQMVCNLYFTICVCVQLPYYHVVDWCAREIGGEELFNSIFMLYLNVRFLLWLIKDVSSIKSKWSMTLREHLIMSAFHVECCDRRMMTHLFRNESVLVSH